MSSKSVVLAPQSAGRKWTPSKRKPATTVRDVGNFWDGVAGGTLVIVDHFAGERRCYAVVAEVARVERRPPARAFAVLEQVLLGRVQKSLAYERGVTPPVIASEAAAAFRALGLTGRVGSAPALLIAAVHARATSNRAQSRWQSFELAAGRFHVVSVARPSPRHLERLAPSERAVIDQLVAGLSKAEIAARRKTSLHTVNNHIASIHRKLGVHNRAHLVCYLIATAALAKQHRRKRLEAAATGAPR